MKITTERGTFDLSSNFTIQIDEKSPITNDMGSQSVPVTIPCTPKNAKITGHAQRIDLGTKTMAGDSSCVIQDGVYVRRGTVNIVSASKKAGITINIGFDNSDAYSKWKETRLNQLTVCPVRTFSDNEQLTQYMQFVYNGDVTTDFAVFPVMIAKPSVNSNNQEVFYPEYLNPVNWTAGENSLKTRERSENMVVNSTLYSTTLPAGYGITGFLRVWRVLELIFEEFGYDLEENPFKTDPELACIVVMNNAADACVTNKLSYLDLMPSCTVEEFLKSIYAKFGAVYSISTDTRKARVRLIRDIVKMTAGKDYSHDVTDYPLITYAEPKQLKLSCKTSLQGAAPEVERFEDFVKDGKKRAFSTDIIGDLYQPLLLEKITGRWYRYSSDIATIKEVSSSFFSWDRKTKNVEYEDIAGEDECVPMTYETGTSSLIPCYMTGAVHRYTEMKISDDTEVSDEKNETPLAFLIAFVRERYQDSNEVTHYPITIGSTFPYDNYGRTAQVGGNDFSFSLVWQYNNGLFMQFWKDYDAILRHANNQIEVDTRLKTQETTEVDFLRPVIMQGQRMLVDAFSYILPSKRDIKVSFVFKTLRLIGPYNLEEEQHIPTIEGLSGSLKWVLTGTNLSALEQAWRDELIQQYNGVEYGYHVISIEMTEDYRSWDRPETDIDFIENYPEEEGEIATRDYYVEVFATVCYQEREADHGQVHYRTRYDHLDKVITYTATFEGRRI